MTTDPIADLLTRIRNASRARHEDVKAPVSKVKLEIVRVLQEEGYIHGFQHLEDKVQGVVRITLKYTGTRRIPVISGIDRVSRPGRRFYVGKKDIPQVLGGLGVAVLSTPKGVMADRDARRLGLGGEVLCRIW